LIRTLFAIAGLTAVAAGAQPKNPQHPFLPPPINNHIANLSRSITGTPMLQPPGARPVHVVGPWYGGGYGGGGWYPQPAMPSTPLVFVNQQNLAPPAPAPILVVNQDYRPEVAKPLMREYSNISNPYENFKPDAPKVFLLALKDGTLRQAVAFWAESDKFHYVQPDHKQDSMPIANLDRESTKRFNSERGLEIKLPE